MARGRAHPLNPPPGPLHPRALQVFTLPICSIRNSNGTYFLATPPNSNTNPLIYGCTLSFRTIFVVECNWYCITVFLKVFCQFRLGV